MVDKGDDRAICDADVRKNEGSATVEELCQLRHTV